MRIASALFLLSIYTADSFAPRSPSFVLKRTLFQATVQSELIAVEEDEERDDVEFRRQSWVKKMGYSFPDHVTPLSGEEIIARRDAQLQKMRMKDKMASYLAKEVCGGCCCYMDSQTDMCVCERSTFFGEPDNSLLYFFLFFFIHRI